MTPSYRLLYETTDDDGDRLRVVDTRDGGVEIGVAPKNMIELPVRDTNVEHPVAFPTPGDLAGLQDALAERTCPESLRDQPRFLLASLAAMSEDLEKIAAYGAHRDVPSAVLLRWAPSLAEAERQIGRAAEALKAAFLAAREEASPRG